MASSIHSEGSAPAATRPPRGWVVRNPSPDELGTLVDWSRWYVTDEEDMGESPEQQQIIELLLSCLKQWAKEQGWKDVFVASDAFFAWVKEHPLVRVSPDIYILDNPPEEKPASWQTWRPGVNPPRFAIEIVSVNWKKDYEDAPERYAQLGCRELVVFDPTAVRDGGRGHRRAFTLFRRAVDGAFVQVYAGPGPVWCDEIGAALVARIEDGPRLRVARDREGTQIVPSADERADNEARRADAAERQAKTIQREFEERLAAMAAELRKARGE